MFQRDRKMKRTVFLQYQSLSPWADELYLAKKACPPLSVETFLVLAYLHGLSGALVCAAAAELACQNLCPTWGAADAAVLYEWHTKHTVHDAHMNQASYQSDL